MSQDRKALLDKANELALEFPSNISTDKLQRLVDEATAQKDEADVGTDTDKVISPVEQEAVNQKVTLRQRVAEAKRKAMKTRVVTITNKDNRENDVATTAFLSFENQYFALAKHVPLDVPVELEEALIDVARSCVITLHKAEVIDGKRTGNAVPVPVNKYVVSYA